MADKEEVIKERIEHSGIFDFSAFYSYVHEWFKEENYGVVEEKYNEKISGNTRDIKFEWLATKKISDYFKSETKLRFDITGLTDVEVEIDGTKKKTNKGRIWLEIKGNIIRDPESKWDVSPFFRFLRDFYNKYIIPARVDKITDRIKDDVRDFKDDLKAYLDLTGKRI